MDQPSEAELEWIGLQALLEVFQPATSGPEKAGPRSSVTAACPIINIASVGEPSPAGAAPTLIAHVVPSVSRPGQLAFRLRPTDRSWRAFFEALEREGFKVGDVVRIEAVR